MGERIRAFDWSSHPLGPPEQWPPALRMAMSLCLNASFPTAIYWGPDFHVLYNDAWSEIPAEKHPWMLGKPAREGWADIWHVVGPQFQQVFEGGQGLASYEQMLPMVRGGQVRETWWNYSLTPIRDAEYGVVGIFNQGNDITQVVRGRRERQAELDRWREMFRQAPAAVALLRGPQHVFEFANDAYMQLVGSRDIVGKQLRQALPEVVEQGFVEILDGVYASGEAYLGAGASVKLQREAGQPAEDRIVDFVYQPLRNAAGDVDGIFVLVTDATERARAESALRLSNWQLGEERARLASLIEAEQRARMALRRFSESLEAHVTTRTAELTRALEAQNAVTDRLRATFATDLIFQGFLDTAGTLLDANPASLAAIEKDLLEVRGRPFWETEWFSATPGMDRTIREAVEAAARGQTVRTVLTIQLAGRQRTFQFLLRPAFNGKREVMGLVPEALEIGADPAADRVVSAAAGARAAAAPSRTAAAP
jgi:PAS domain-containing protein